jgi:hypothetical protein
MHAQKVAGRRGPGLSGEMDPKTRAAAAAAANALFIFLLSEPPDGQKLPRQVKPYAHSQVVIRLCCDIFWSARTALLILPAANCLRCLCRDGRACTETWSPAPSLVDASLRVVAPARRSGTTTMRMCAVASAAKGPPEATAREAAPSSQTPDSPRAITHPHFSQF